MSKRIELVSLKNFATRAALTELAFDVESFLTFKMLIAF
jgi:hypothetical protein